MKILVLCSQPLSDAEADTAIVSALPGIYSDDEPPQPLGMEVCKLSDPRFPPHIKAVVVVPDNWHPSFTP